MITKDEPRLSSVRAALGLRLNPCRWISRKYVRVSLCTPAVWLAVVANLVSTATFAQSLGPKLFSPSRLEDDSVPPLLRTIRASTKRLPPVITPNASFSSGKYDAPIPKYSHSTEHWPPLTVLQRLPSTGPAALHFDRGQVHAGLHERPRRTEIEGPQFAPTQSPAGIPSPTEESGFWAPYGASGLLRPQGQNWFGLPAYRQKADQLAQGQSDEAAEEPSSNQEQSPPANEDSANSDDDEFTSEKPSQIGEAPEDTNLQFLRRAVLLPPGEWQLDYGISYAWQETQLPLFAPPDQVSTLRSRRRNLIVPAGFRYGYSECLQLFMYAPVGWSHSEVLIGPLQELEDEMGFGDFSAGMNVLLHEATRDTPEAIGTFGFTLPTGDPVSPVDLGDSGMGEGFWSIFFDLLFVQSRDPVAVFWGAGCRYRFEEDFGGQYYQPGIEFTYRLGAGFAMNEHYTASAALFGSVSTAPQLNAITLPGGISEPVNLRLALTVQGKCNVIIEPFVTFGLTSDATALELGVIFTQTGGRRKTEKSTTDLFSDTTKKETR